ncbi:MAG: DUF378 domain-containing protein [Candidatus Caenarcaniphilales bacterium]|jgi:hypothetical protein|nr:DUF378 domain-containing protein [Candidatus Caenarcaniphilales bacterium]
MNNLVGTLASILLVVGGLNWGLVGVLHMDLVQMLFGHFGMIADLVYGLVGLSAIYHILQGKVFGGTHLG